MIDAQLNEHQQRRNQGIPCLTVVAGQVPAASQAVKAWLKANARDAVWVDGRGIDAAVGTWLRLVLLSKALRAVLIEEIATRTGRTPDDVESLTQNAASADVRAILDSAYPADAIAGRRAAAEAAFLRGAALDEVVEAAQVERASALAYINASAHWLPAEALPVLGAVVADNDTVEITVRHLANMVRSVPRFTVVLVAANEPMQHFLDLVPATREQDLCRDGLIVLGETAAGTQRAEALPEDLRVLRDAAADRVNAAHTNPAEDDNARSAAERFLFAILEATPETKGRFHLNARYSIPFGSAQSMEIDLSAAEPQIAIEIDGYWHFQDPQRYRTDRAKDLALQRKDWIVYRILADDVVNQFEQIRTTVIELLRARG